MLAFHHTTVTKSEIIAQLTAHLEADELVKGQYWEDGKGCAVGCTIHSDDHAEYESRFGIPQILARLEDCIFEELPNGTAKEWPLRFMWAISPGADLSLVGWKFLHWLLTDKIVNPGIDHPLVCDAVRQCADVLAPLSKGEPLDRSAASAARRAAWSAASAARGVVWSVESAAGGAAWSVESAAESVESAAESAAESALSADSALSAESVGSAAWSAAWSAAKSAADSALSAESAAASAASAAKSAAESAAESALSAESAESAERGSWSAASAAWRAAKSAAESALSAESVERAAWSAAWVRMADKLIALLEAAPVLATP